MVKKRILIFIFMIIGLFFINGCNKENNEPDGVKVIYNLEGGTFQNCTLPIKQYYQYDGNNCYIKDPQTLSKDKIIKSGYTLEGWYTENTYQNKWDFEKDSITDKGITLYAKWEKIIKYTYNVCYYDENNQLQVINSYSVEPGEKFEDWAKYAEKRPNYTPLGYYDENENPWDENFKHPGGETDTAVNVIVKYLEGEYAIVSTAKELKKSLNKNIYLVADIDLQGETFSFADYNKIFMGNDHKISNFKVKYDSSLTGLVKDSEDESLLNLYIGIFDNIKDATIQNVTFENVIYEVNTFNSRINKIVVVPLANKITNSKVSNVTIKGNYSYTMLPKDPFNKDTDLIYYTTKEQISVEIDSESQLNNIEIIINTGEEDNE
ncbi:MAG: InlB B-repeat-containing protein [Bacilli bacterium]|nr:InlB B-repeat-containing protein [Bacilli bacterium]